MGFKTVTIELRYPNLHTITRSRSRDSYAASVRTLYREALSLLRQYWDPPEKLRLIGLRASNLRPIEGQT